MPSNSSGRSRVAPALVDGVGRQLKQDLAGKGVALWVQRPDPLGHLTELQIIGDARQRHSNRLGAVLAVGSSASPLP
jgi:hypothetical protein